MFVCGEVVNYFGYHCDIDPPHYLFGYLAITIIN
jgi:hypothetical protein